MPVSSTLWHTADRQRWFILADASVHLPGSLQLKSTDGSRKGVDPLSVQAFEVSEEQARRWAHAELGETLGQLRQGIGTKLGEWRKSLEAFKQSSVSPANPDDPAASLSTDSGPALLDLLKSLPGVIGQSISGDPKRVDTARETLAKLQERLQQSGIDVDDRVKGFADRLASIRTEAAAKEDEPPKD